MRVSDSKRLAFVHHPKAGGVTIEKVLGSSLGVRVDQRRRQATLEAGAASEAPSPSA